MEEIVAQAKDFVLRNGYHPSVLWISGVLGRRYIVIDEFPNEPDEKVSLLFRAGKIASETSKSKIGMLNNVFLIMEAWMVREPKNLSNQWIRPSMHPNRIETLIIACLDVKSKEQTVTTLEYVRDGKGNLIEIKDNVLPHGVSAQSPLLPAFVAGYTL